MQTLMPASWRQAVTRLRHDIHRALGRWFHKNRDIDSNDDWSPVPLTVGSPLIDIAETDEAVIVEAELPGLKRDDFTVELTGERLVIRGEIKHSAETCAHGYVYTERSYGAFARAVRLPCEIDPDQAQARYKWGVLRLTLPKTARAKARRVKINIQG